MATILPAASRRRPPGRWRSPTRWIAWNSRSFDVLAAALWLPLAYPAWESWSTTRAPLALPLLALNLLIVVLFLVRRPGRDVSQQFGPWALGLAGTLAPLLMRAQHQAIGPLQAVSLVLEGVALAGSLLTLLALGRSFGVVPAHRGLVKRGPYRWVRHPLYTFEIAFYAAFTIGEPSLRNLLLLALCALLQMGRAEQEEYLLNRDLRYRDYRRQVPYRFVWKVY